MFSAAGQLRPQFSAAAAVVRPEPGRAVRPQHRQAQIGAEFGSRSPAGSPDEFYLIFHFFINLIFFIFIFFAKKPSIPSRRLWSAKFPPLRGRQKSGGF